MSKPIKSLKIMLPYMNDEYVVGCKIDFINQASHSDNEAKVEEYGKITKIVDNTVESDTLFQSNYWVEFENGKEIDFFGVPVQIGY